MTTNKSYSCVTAAERTEANLLPPNFQGMIGNCPHNIRESIHPSVKTTDDHRAILAIVKTLAFLDLGLHTSAKGIVNRTHDIDVTIDKLINIGDRAFIHRMNEGDGKFITLLNRKRPNYSTGISTFQD